MPDQPYSVYIGGTLASEDQEQEILDAIRQLVADLGDHMSEARFVGGFLPAEDFKASTEPEVPADEATSTDLGANQGQIGQVNEQSSTDSAP